MKINKFKIVIFVFIIVVISGNFISMVAAQDNLLIDKNTSFENSNTDSKTPYTESYNDDLNKDLDVTNDVIQNDIKVDVKQNNIVAGWNKIDGKWYYFDNNGVKKVGWIKVNTQWYYMNSSGAMQTGWEKVSGQWYYMNSSGAMQTGWEKVSGQWYYMSSRGTMQTGWLELRDKKYYLNNNGAMQEVGWAEIENTRYYISSSGAIQTGWLELEGQRYYFDASGIMQTGWEKVSEKWYYMDSDGVMQTGWQEISGKRYYLDSNSSGAMQTGWTQVSSTWYYMNSSGAMQTGWLTLGDKKYYLKSNGAMQEMGWTEIDSTKYYVSKSGAIQKGWLELEGQRYYFDASGIMQTGWEKVSEKWYYMDSDGVMQTGWQKISGKWYYMDSSGEMQTGWNKVGSKWYYMNSSGEMQTGWNKVGSKWYYMNSSGAMQTGWIKIKGTWYYMDSSGAMQDKNYYSNTLKETLKKQMATNPQTDYYNGYWKNAKEEDVLFFLNPKNFLEDKLPAAFINTSSSNLNLRALPTVAGNKIGEAIRGKTYIILDQKDDWYKILTHNRIGWISRTYAKLTSMNNNQRYQFLDLSKNAGIKVTDLNGILSGKGILEGRGATFINASKQQGINEIYLASHAMLETGNGRSSLARGIEVRTVDGESVIPRTVYNMFGIGAFDRDAVRLGSEYAYKQGWVTPELAIIGGAKFVGEKYIYRKNNMQNTLYKMRWNPEKPATNQYATDIAWASKQASIMKGYYDLCSGYELHYDIPQYK